MKVLVFSDSHGRTSGMLHAIQAEKPDHVIHLGDVAADVAVLRETYPDIPIHAVTGNNDWKAIDDPYTQVIVLNGVRIFLCHGHTLRVRYDLLPLWSYAKQEQCAVALYGHTHMEQICQEDGIWIMNPGSIALPHYGKRSYLRMKISDGGQVHSEIVYPDDARQRTV